MACFDSVDEGRGFENFFEGSTIWKRGGQSLGRGQFKGIVKNVISLVFRPCTKPDVDAAILRYLMTKIGNSIPDEYPKTNELPFQRIL